MTFSGKARILLYKLWSDVSYFSAFHISDLSTLTLLQVQIVAKKMFLKRQMVVNEFFIKFLLLKSSHSQVKNSAN